MLGVDPGSTPTDDVLVTCIDAELRLSAEGTLLSFQQKLTSLRAGDNFLEKSQPSTQRPNLRAQPMWFNVDSSRYTVSLRYGGMIALSGKAGAEPKAELSPAGDRQRRHGTTKLEGWGMRLVGGEQGRHARSLTGSAGVRGLKESQSSRENARGT